MTDPNENRLASEVIAFLKNVLYTIRDSHMSDDDIRDYVRVELIKFEGGYY